ncbi:MAG: asparagine synthetase B [Chloroflexi bacterium]|nr:asparagine synthetase B [Chloroflexota bacterium]
MSGIFGIFHKDGRPIDRAALETMRRAMADWGRDGCGIWCDGPVGLGQALTMRTPEAHLERLPRTDGGSGVAFTAAARLDNRTQLAAALGIPPAELAGLADGDLVLRAYNRWGEDCPTRIYGDWSFAVWRPAERRLFLARDHYGHSGLYYFAGERTFAFASDRRALLALNLAPVEMDELILAAVLVSWAGCQGERTLHKPLKRLPPARMLVVTPERLETRQYWHLERVPELRLSKREDYVAAFQDVFDEAVRCRLRANHPAGGQGGSGDHPIAVTLSGGLDSGSVTATAAGMLRERGERLLAFTSVPLSDTTAYVGPAFGDELPFARATAEHAGNVDLHTIPAADVSPIAAIRRSLQVHGEPGHAAGNYYWILDLLDTARSHGCGVLLTGQCGNASISWKGDLFSQSFLAQGRQLGWRWWAKETLERQVPTGLSRLYRRIHLPPDPWRDHAAIHPEFARRLKLRDRLLDDPTYLLAPPLRNPRQQRCQIVRPGRSVGGALWAENSAASGLDVRDPTADVRVLEFTFSVPDWVFRDPDVRLDRWLIRAAMKGRLPDMVRLNRKRGRQAGDLVPRLRRCAGDVEVALDRLEHGPAAEYVDLPYMREAWQLIQTADTAEAFKKAVTVLTRGIGVGLWVNAFRDAR